MLNRLQLVMQRLLKRHMLSQQRLVKQLRLIVRQLVMRLHQRLKLPLLLMKQVQQRFVRLQIDQQ